MLRRLRIFTRSEDGAITVDWVLLTALILGMQIILLLTPIRGALVDVSNGIGNEVEDYGEFLN
ncbi:MAG: hypothetical protein WAT09_11735 [Paracoccaceae bacterium]